MKPSISAACVLVLAVYICPICMAFGGPALSAPKTELSELQKCRQENQEIVERLERLEKILNATASNVDMDDLSHLELAWEGAKWLVLKSIPPTDQECYFNYTALNCYPLCACSFRPKLGDYSISRACRKVDEDDKRALSCDSDATLPKPRYRIWFNRLGHAIGNLFRGSSND